MKMIKQEFENGHRAKNEKLNAKSDQNDQELIENKNANKLSL